MIDFPCAVPFILSSPSFLRSCLLPHVLVYNFRPSTCFYLVFRSATCSVLKISFFSSSCRRRVCDMRLHISPSFTIFFGFRRLLPFFARSRTTGSGEGEVCRRGFSVHPTETLSRFVIHSLGVAFSRYIIGSLLTRRMLLM